MPYLRIEQMKVVSQRLRAQPAVRCAVELCVGAAHRQVDAVNIAHELKSFFLAGVSPEIAAEAVRDIVFPVGHTARAAEAVHDAARFAVDAGGYLLSVYRTAALFDRCASVEHKHADILFHPCEFISHEYAARACADNYNIIVIHRIIPPPVI